MSSVQVVPLVGRTRKLAIDVAFAQRDTVALLAQKIANATGISLSSLRLCFNGAALVDGAVELSAAGIDANSFVVAFSDRNALCLRWVDASDGTIPAAAVRTGAESNGTKLYLARVYHGKGMHPGKAARPLGGARAGYGGAELCAKSYQVLIATDSRSRPWPEYHHAGGTGAGPPSYSSLPCAPVGPGGRLPDGALAAGYEADGTPLFSAVALDPNGGACPGKLQRGWEGASVGWGGSEKSLSPAHAICLPAGVSPPRDDAAPPVPQPRLRRYLQSVDELLAWTPSAPAADVDPPTATNASSTTNASSGSTAPAIRPLASGRPRVLHCHDMMGGYCQPADEGYLESFSGWGSIDAFIYFAHHRVSLPPQCWIDACHARGLPCLGTFITEGNDGVRDNAKMLQRADETAERLAELAAVYGFDGWLINIEAPVHPTAVPSLVEMLQLLTICAKTRIGEHALVLYYDSLDATTGGIAYQNGLSPANQIFFDACDGLFTNYWWSAAVLARSAQLAGAARRFDVYAGIDCFARGPNPSFPMPYKAGGCGTGVKMVADAGLSLAVFAPGWSLECGEAAKCERTEEAAQCDKRFWDALGCERLRR